MRLATGILSVAASLAWCYSFAYAAEPAAKAATTAAAPADSDIDPAAMAALNKMGAYLRTLKAFQVTAVTSTDDVTDDGQLIENDAVTSLLAQAPNKLRMEVIGDNGQRLYFYDGKSLTLWAALMNYYAKVPAPPTIVQLSDALHDKFGIDLPLEDLFLWGGPRAATKDIKAAMDAGPSQVDGVTCEQYVFRQEGMDWQIWIQNGDYPLPRKLVLTTTSDEARPRHTSVLAWNLAPSYNEAAFSFDPPKDAHRIAVAEIREAAAAAKK